MIGRISQHAIGYNCNAKYIDGLSNLGKAPTKPAVYKALYDLFSVQSAFSKDRKTIQYMGWSAGYVMFHRGSEHSAFNYADAFAEAITELNLGKVVKQEPAANGLHGGKTGILYVWIPDYPNISRFWHEYHQHKGVLGKTRALVEEIRKQMDF